MLDSYAARRHGRRGLPLDPDVRRRLIPAAARAEQRALVARPRRRDGRRAGQLFFTASRPLPRVPLLNVHDLAVVPAFRGQGVGRALLDAAERRARTRGCAKLTLEVREDNARARALYHAQGFRDFELAGASHRTLFFGQGPCRVSDGLALLVSWCGTPPWLTASARLSIVCQSIAPAVHGRSPKRSGDPRALAVQQDARALCALAERPRTRRWWSPSSTDSCAASAT